jgi:glycosyltransferase involved in cell wall biosynthesis
LVTEQPTFSIIVPTYKRLEHLQNCLEAVAGLDYPRLLFEVVVVDDGSGEPPEQLVSKWKDRLNVRLIVQEHSGPAAARNTGALSSQHEYVVFTDDDCAPFPNWLSNLAKRFRELPHHGIGGHTINGLLENPYSTASQILIDYLYSYFNTEGEARFFTSNNLAFPRMQFLEIGGFDSTFRLAAGEDREICYRWRRAGYLLTYAPEIRLYHRHPLGWRSFWRQHFNYGRGAYRYHQLRARKDLEPIRMEPPSFYFNLVRYGFVHKHAHPATLLACLMGITQVANAAGFLWEKTTGKES